MDEGALGEGGFVDGRSDRVQRNESGSCSVERAQRMEQTKLLRWQWYFKRGAGDVHSPLQGPCLRPDCLGLDPRSGTPSAWRVAGPGIAPPPLKQPSDRFRHCIRFNCTHHVLYHCAVGLSRHPSPAPRACLSTMGQLSPPRRASRGQAGPQDWGEARSRALRRPHTHEKLHREHVANWPVQVLMAIMSGVFGLAGWHFCTFPQWNDAIPAIYILIPQARSPTSSSSERAVAKAIDSEPWKSGGTGPYQYHPGGDPNVKKDAPSALNVVVIPNVTLPKACIEFHIRSGPADSDRNSTTHTTSGARMGIRCHLGAH